MTDYWYAVQRDEDDNDWGTGSYDLVEAMEMAKRHKWKRIAVIEEGNDPICVKEIEVEIEAEPLDGDDDIPDEDTARTLKVIK